MMTTMMTKQTVENDLAFMKVELVKDGDILNVLIPKKRKRHKTYFNKDRQKQLKELYDCRKVRITITDENIAEKIAEINDIEVNIVEDADTLFDLYTTMDDSTHMAIDFETDSVDAKNANIISVGITFLPYEETYYIPINHTGAKNIPIDKVSEFLSMAAHYYQLPFLVWNLSFERKLLKRLDVDVPNYVDVMIYNYLAADYGKMGLKDVALHRLGVFMKRFEDVVGTGKKAIPFADVDVEDAAQYCGSDALYTAQLYKLFKENYGIPEELLLLDHRAALTCCDMESEGALLDDDLCWDLTERCGRRQQRLESLIYATAGGEFNINSTQQLAEVLYTQLGIEPREKYCYTPKGALSTSSQTIDRLIEDGEDNRILKHLKEYRNVTNKVLGTYLGMWDKIDEKTGRFHPYFNFCGTATGRLSSNIQQLPKSGIGGQIRAGIIAPEGFKIVAADYSQIEFRIFAHILENEELIDMIKAGHDIHRATAANIFDKKLEDVTDSERSAAKTIVFGLLYGQRENKTAATLGISVEEAKNFIGRYFSAFPTAKDLIDSSIELAKQQGYAETLFNRRRYLPDLHSRNWGKKAEAERQCFNTIIQGTAADIIRLSMASCNDMCKDTYPREAKLIFQVHDELVFYVKEEILEEFIADLEKTMTSVVDFRVPLKVDINYGENYLQAK